MNLYEYCCYINSYLLDNNYSNVYFNSDALSKLEEDKVERFKEGDIVHVNMGLVYKHFTKEYDAVLLWNGYNSQPLLTKLGEYKPHWASYDEIESVIGHIDLEKALTI